MFAKIKGKSGLTLIELLITMGLLAILLGVSIPLINQTWLPRYRLKSAARNLASNMQLARLKAITTNVRHGIYFDGASGYRLYSDDNNNKNFDSGEEEKTVILENVTCTTAPQTINFLPAGTATADRVIIRNSKGQTTDVIVLGTTGRIRIE